MRLAREESGFTLVELMVSMAIMIGVLSATLGTLEVFGTSAATNQKLVVAQDQARLALDQIARELRNGTAYTTDIPQPSAVVRALPWDLIVQTVNPQPSGAGNQNTLNLMRVRYCLDTTAGNLWRQAQTWTSAASPAVIADTSCPSTGWTNRRVVASNVVNGGSRRVFTYNKGNAADVNEASPLVEDISSVRIAVWVDLDPARAPAETQLATGVFLRNKNRRPVADCTASATGHGHVSLNGSHSSDPEGGALTFAWADGTTPISGSGSLVDYVSPTTGPHSFTLTVTDPGGLPGQFTCQVNVL
jgi:prepilin-type N-terminal cleavage/methylation domain-containing protein